MHECHFYTEETRGPVERVDAALPRGIEGRSRYAAAAVSTAASYNKVENISQMDNHKVSEKKLKIQ